MMRMVFSRLLDRSAMSQTSSWLRNTLLILSTKRTSYVLTYVIESARRFNVTCKKMAFEGDTK